MLLIFCRGPHVTRGFCHVPVTPMGACGPRLLCPLLCEIPSHGLIGGLCFLGETESPMGIHPLRKSKQFLLLSPSIFPQQEQGGKETDSRKTAWTIAPGVPLIISWSHCGLTGRTDPTGAGKRGQGASAGRQPCAVSEQTGVPSGVSLRSLDSLERF